MHIIDTSGFNWDVVDVPTPEYERNPYTPLVGAGITSIDLRSTLITDSETGESAPLSSFFKQIENERLQMSTDAVISDGSEAAAFDFQYDDETDQYGAGTAFLQEE